MRSSILLSLFTVAAMGSTTSAHVDLYNPTPRYTMEVAGANKACPCGVGQSNRLCNVEGDRSDSNRAAEDRVTSFAAGSTITLRFEEYVGHSGRYRVAIDYDGADLEDFNQNILLDIPDPPGKDGNIGDGSFWEIDVTLPNASCDKCTLQLVQIMDGNVDDPVMDPTGRSSYYTCADIKITDGEPVPDVDAGVVDPAADAGGGTSGEASGSGCSIGSPGDSRWPLFPLFLLAAFWVADRKHRVR